MRLIRTLSLDVVAGAACGGFLAESVTGETMRPAWWIALLCAVWSIYAGDHLLDAWRVPGPLATYRHAFHRKHARGLAAALGIALVAGVIASFELRPPVRILGLALGGLVLIYLASAQGLVLVSLPKEIMAGLLYAAGIWGGPLIMSHDLAAWQFGAAAFHALAAILNLAALGIFEIAADRQMGSRSLALRLGPATARHGVNVASAAGCGLALLAGLSSPLVAIPIFAVLAMQIAMPAGMLLGCNWFGQKDRYRTWGDAVFLLGAVPRLLS